MVVLRAVFFFYTEGDRFSFSFVKQFGDFRSLNNFLSS